MVNAYYVSRNQLKSDGLETLKKHINFVWLDCVNPSKKDLKEISEKTGVLVDDLEQGLDEGERPRISLSDGYAQIIFSTPENIGKSVKTISFSIFILKNSLITLRKNELDVFTNILLYPDQKKVEMLSKSPSHFLHELLENIGIEYFRVTDQIEDVIEKIDSHLFKNVDNKVIVKQIFDARTTLIFLHKSLVANREVLSALESRFLTQVEKPETKKFRMVHNDLTQLLELVGTYREILQTSLELYMTNVSNNLNQVMKRLTVYASYVMVPTLISGIYGMNFRFMPEIAWKYGYWFALGLMVVSILGMRMMFKKKGWL